MKKRVDKMTFKMFKGFLEAILIIAESQSGKDEIIKALNRIKNAMK